MNHLCCCRALPWYFIDRNTPHTCNVLSVLWYVDVPIARQLVGFLPDLTSTLAVALPSDHHGAATWLAELPTSQRKINARQAVVHTVGAVLNTSRVHNQRGCRPAIEACCRHDAFSRHS